MFFKKREDNKALEDIIEKDREKFVTKYAWMFDQMEKDRQIKNSIQASADDKLNNMIEGNKCNRLMFAENEPLSMVMFNDYKHVNVTNFILKNRLFRVIVNLVVG